MREPGLQGRYSNLTLCASVMWGKPDDPHGRCMFVDSHSATYCDPPLDLCASVMEGYVANPPHRFIIVESRLATYCDPPPTRDIGIFLCASVMKYKIKHMHHNMLFCDICFGDLL